MLPCSITCGYYIFLFQGKYYNNYKDKTFICSTAFCDERQAQIKKFISLNSLPPSDAVQKQKKNILEDLFSSVLSQFKKISPF